MLLQQWQKDFNARMGLITRALRQEISIYSYTIMINFFLCTYLYILFIHLFIY